MPHPSELAVVRHPEAACMVALDPAVDYPADDILAATYPQFFRATKPTGDIVESVSIEAATAAPGEKRARSKAK
jgi:hypothetical protein